MNSKQRTEFDLMIALRGELSDEMKDVPFFKVIKLGKLSFAYGFLAQKCKKMLEKEGR